MRVLGGSRPTTLAKSAARCFYRSAISTCRCTLQLRADKFDQISIFLLAQLDAVYFGHPSWICPKWMAPARISFIARRDVPVQVRHAHPDNFGSLGIPAQRPLFSGRGIQTK